ncbi:MAG: SMC-Scp complex subunit ScpB [Gammaproteobacteria bacterium]|nr:SMC-Scp complex subunit ScpB [Gammaproteobacteria bacterium]
MEQKQLKLILEAALMAAEGPVTLERLAGLFLDEGEDGPSRDDVKLALMELVNDCEERAIELVEVASGYRFQTRVDLAPWVNRLWEERKPRYSRALLETLAIVAYRQPITRGEIEDIRGVAVSSGIMRTLLERDWLKVVGHRDVPGRPAVYATTKQFLDYFNLKNLSDLPTLAELKDLDDINPDLFAEFEAQVRENADESVLEAENPAASVGAAVVAAVAIEAVAEDDEEHAEAEAAAVEPVAFVDEAPAATASASDEDEADDDEADDDEADDDEADDDEADDDEADDDEADDDEADDDEADDDEADDDEEEPDDGQAAETR